MRVAIITESYAPDINGVANSVVRVAAHLTAAGHQPLVIAPRPRRALRQQISTESYPVVRLPSLPLPGYPNVRLAPPAAAITAALREHRPDVVHLASPFILGAWGATAATKLGLPIVAVYQTDVPGYASAYGVGIARRAAWRWIHHIHDRARVTLAPSTATADQLRHNGIHGITRWGRGVDTELFHPRRRDHALRKEWAPNGELIVGYVGRLAHEKCADLLHEAAKLPGVRLIVVGDGPTREKVRKAIPQALFLGTRNGLDLARIYASLDVFAHTGPHETFCQTIQEAMASGLPVIAPASGGPLDLVKPEITGILVQPGDADALADAVAVLSANPALRRRYGRAAHLAVAEHTWAALGDELIAHYQTAMNLTHPSPAPLALAATPAHAGSPALAGRSALAGPAAVAAAQIAAAQATTSPSLAELAA
jgi:phosphatidylinositol alpha 1,6-mannosyltransferase